MSCPYIRWPILVGALFIVTFVFSQFASAQATTSHASISEGLAATPASHNSYLNYGHYYRTQPHWNGYRYGYRAPYGERHVYPYGGYRYDAPGFPYRPYRYYGYPEWSYPYGYYTPYRPYRNYGYYYF